MWNDFFGVEKRVSGRREAARPRIIVTNKLLDTTADLLFVGHASQFIGNHRVCNRLGRVRIRLRRKPVLLECAALFLESTRRWVFVFSECRQNCEDF
jgi:hypothetical protein